VDRRQLEHVLLHELAHLQRRDAWWSLACLAVQVAYWFHPIAWLACRRLAVLRECACDEAVARLLGADASGYRRTLLELARPLMAKGASPGLGLFWSRSQLLERLGPSPGCAAAGGRRRTLVTATVAAALAVSLFPLAWPVARSRASPLPAVALAPDLLSQGELQSAELTARRAPFQWPPGNLPERTSPPAVAVAAASASPNLHEPQGCLQLRYAVLGLLAAESAGAPS
jgi:hypothetical protein